MAGKSWTKDELDFVNSNYNTLSFKEIGKKLNRTESSIQLKINRLGLKINNIRPSVGTKFNRLTILEYINKNNVKCICDCGREKSTKFVNLIYNQVKSCGCSRIGSKGHGLKNDPIYSIWLRMKAKCYNKKYHRYEEGLMVCDDWKNNFKSFYDWAKPKWNNKLKLERKDLTIGFSPDNCIFLTAKKARSKYEDRAISSNLKNFGVEYPSQREDIQQKAINTKQIKYGTAAPKSTRGEEFELKNYVNDLGFNFKANSDILNGQEIDLYDPSLKLGIEYCGLYWHHENSKQPRKKDYHYNKYIECLNKNIQLITIFSDEWKFRQEQAKFRLKALCKIFERKVFARNCIVSEIDSLVGKNFIDQYHIQEQKRKAIFYNGLFHNNELIGVLSINKHHRDGNKYILDRLCFKPNISITGGASKLWSHTLDWCIKNNISNIITWSDNRWSSGNVYSNMNFKLIQELKPDYSYVKINNPKTRISKQSMKKQNTNCPPDKTEKQWCLELGYSRIWDCGKKRFEYNIN